MNLGKILSKAIDDCGGIPKPRMVAECWTCWHSPRAGMITNRPNLCCYLPMTQQRHPRLLDYCDAGTHCATGHDVRPVREKE